MAAAFTIGKLAYPPVPMTTSGRNCRRMARASPGARRRFPTETRLCRISRGLKDRWKLEMWTVRKSYPALGIRSFSSPRSAPTNKNSVSGSFSRISWASAIAGFTCPAVPPQVKITFFNDASTLLHSNRKI